MKRIMSKTEDTPIEGNSRIQETAQKRGDLRLLRRNRGNSHHPQVEIMGN